MPRESVRVDVCVVGRGVAGSIAAAELARGGLTCAVVAASGGASQMSSGLFDAGRPPDDDTNYEGYRRRPETEVVFRDLLIDGHPFADLSQVTDGYAALRALLGPELFEGPALDKPLAVPTSGGTRRRTFAAQKPLADGARIANEFGPIAVLRSAELRREASDDFSQAGSAAFLPFRLPLKGFDWPVASIAARLDADAAFADAFADRVAETIPPGCTGLLLPPLALRLGEDSFYPRLAKRLAIPVGEYVDPLSPIAGLRLTNALVKGLEELSVQTILANELVPTRLKKRLTSLASPTHEIVADRWVFATGRFLGGGLRAGFQRVRETILDLPLFRRRNDPAVRFRRLLAREATPLDGLEALGPWLDGHFRPRDEQGEACFENVYIAGVVGGVDLAKHRLGIGFLATAGAQVAAEIAGRRRH